jgi:hypothetical protein
MKKTLLIAALTIAAAPAFASKARLSALQSSAHLSDFQNSFTQPQQLTTSGEMATFEWGATTASAGVPNAEGGFVRAMGEGHLGFYLDRQPEALTKALSDLSLTSTQGGLNNPFNVLYSAKAGDMTWGANFYYLNSDVKGTTSSKANVMGLAVGATNGMWDANAVIGLAGTINTKNIAFGTVTGTQEGKITSKTNIALGGGYQMENMYYYGNYAMGGVKAENSTTGAAAFADTSRTDIKIGFVNSHKKDGTDFFYGAAYRMINDKNDAGTATKTDTTSLPFIIGVEAEAASWLVFRGSITQNVLLGSTKAGSADASTLAADTTVAAGLGMKWNKFMLDGTFANTANGKVGFDSTGFLSNVSMSYMFYFYSSNI